MHWIQIYILEQLLYVQTLRNRDMRPAKVESNLYQYHLKQLIKDGWIIKCDKVYTLAPKGLAWADRYSSELRSARQQAKVISVLIIENSVSEFLLITRERQPFLGSLIIPSGKVKMGEPTSKAAQRELKEKTGLEEIALTMAGTARIITMSNEDVITDAVAFVWHGRATDHHVKQTSDGATWIDFNNLSKRQTFPGSLELLDAFIRGQKHIEITMYI